MMPMITLYDVTCAFIICCLFIPHNTNALITIIYAVGFQQHHATSTTSKVLQGDFKCLWDKMTQQ